MSDEAALRHMIEVDPDDDAVRLLYADWLDERGQPERAEFIRVQIKWSRLREHTPEARKLLDRAKELLRANARVWPDATLPHDADKVKIEYERGFPARLTLTDPTPDDFAILPRLPALRWLVLAGRCELTPLALELIAGLRWLDVLCIWDTEVSPDALAAFEQLPPWVVFSIGVAGGDDALRAFHARRLARFERLPTADRRAGAIRSLRIAHDIFPPHPGELVKVIRLPWLSNTDHELARLGAIPEVEEVHIASGPITAAQLRPLARFPNLTTVNLGTCEVESPAPLAACPKLTRYQTLWDDYTGAELRNVLSGSR